MIEDLGSRNGTRVNGALISGPTSLNPGDVITMSASAIMVGGDGAGVGSEESFLSTQGAILRSATDLIAESERGFAQSRAVEQQELQHAADQLHALYDVHQALDASATVDQLLDGVLERVFKHMQPDHGAIFLKDRQQLVRGGEPAEDRQRGRVSGVAEPGP